MLFGITHSKHGTGYLGFFAFLQLTQPIFSGYVKETACVFSNEACWLV